jgi:hypothetical protein
MAVRMSPLRTRRTALEVRQAGSALLVCPAGGADPVMLRFAERLAAWPGHVAVCLDVPSAANPEDFGALADELAEVGDLPVLVPLRAGLTSTLRLGAWLAQRGVRPVVAHEGAVRLTAGGGAFLPPGDGAGWVRVEAGADQEPYSRRFPRPWWEGGAVSLPRELGGGWVVEPLPGGAWLRPPGNPGAVDEYRRLLMSGLVPEPQLPRLVAGFPGGPPVSVGRVAEYCTHALADLLAALRISRFGPADTPPERFGPELADAVDAPVVVSCGVRLLVSDGRGGHEMRTVLPEGPMDWTPYAHDFGYLPGSAEPAPVGHRAPIEGLDEEQHGVYAYRGDAVLEVTQSGLWLRSAQDRSDASGVRLLPPEPGHVNVFVGATDSRSAPGRRTMALVHEVIGRLEPQARAAARLMFAAALEEPRADRMQRTRVQPATAEAEPASVPEPEPMPLPEPVAEPETVSFEHLQLVSSPSPAFDVPGFDLPDFGLPEPAAGPATATASEAAPEPEPESVPVSVSVSVSAPAKPVPAAVSASASASAAGPRVQPVPSARAAALPPPAGIGEERAWLRRNLSKQYDAAASSVARVLSEHPGLRAAAATASADVLTDLVAVSLYLDGTTRDLDDAVRSGTVGPHVPLARCVAAGLRRLPSFRGATRLRADLDEAQRRWYAERELITEWSFCPVLTSGRLKLPGDADVLIWSMTARRTGLIDPSVPEQAVFAPGTKFKRLRAEGPGGEIYLRELADTEVAADGTVRAREALDELALRTLETAAEVLRRDPPVADLDDGLADRYSSPPGLLGRASRVPAGSPSPAAAGTAATTAATATVYEGRAA